MREWGVYFKLEAEDAKERQLKAQAEAEGDRKLQAMKRDPYFKRGRGGG